MFDGKEKVIALLILITVLFSIFTIFVYSDSAPSVSAKAAALFEPETRKFLYSKKQNERLSMASTTKIMTALIALENLPLDKIIQVDDRAIGIDGSSIYLKNGENLTAESLIYALMLRSANDAAEALAYEISGSIEEFCRLMNERAAELSLKDTHFSNPHGLDADNHYTTAHDLAIITAEALKNEKFREISSTYKKEIDSSETTRLLVNHNKLLKSYEGCIGVKTGYTKKSGRSLVSAADKNDITLISVTINAPDDWNDHRKLLDYGFSRIHAEYLLAESGFTKEVPLLNANRDTITVKNAAPFKMIYDGARPDISQKIFMNAYLVAPIKEGDTVGKIVFIKDGKEFFSVDIIAAETIEAKSKKTLSDRLKKHYT